MADCERIKHAMRALEDECAIAQAQAQCLNETHHEDANTAAWVFVHQNTVAKLTEAADELIEALHRGAPWPTV